MNLIYKSGRDLRDQPLENPDETWFTDGSSFVRKDVKHAGYAIVISFKTRGQNIASQDVSSEKLITLTRALQLERDKMINIYINSK